MRTARYFVVLTFVASQLVACGGSSAPEERAAGSTAPATDGRQVATDKSAYPVFPNQDSGADPSVPAEQGGKGFTGEGWETNADYDLIGDPRAVKGGVFREFQLDFPTTLRLNGPEANTVLNSMIGGMAYETLLGLHPTTLDYIPVLATHWQISPDKMTYRFRIDPNARFSDGQPVTADDVIASWALMVDKGLQDPMTELVYTKYDKPVAESRYIVRVTSKVLNWRNFLYFAASMPILPAHVLKTVNGDRYVKEYNFKLLPGTGPYVINEADVVKGRSITIRRRPGYWAENVRRNIGSNNFDEIREIVVRDQKLAIEMFKRGDLDYYAPVNATFWVQELGDIDRIQRGLIQKRKVYNDNPMGTVGMAINMRKPPFDDVRVRQALAHLLNRPLIVEKLFYSEVIPIDSYYSGGIYENPKNPKMQYDPQLAVKLLAEAGWKDRDAQGRLTRNGQPLTMELMYANKITEPALTTYQEELRKLGVTLNLRFLTPETMFQLMGDRRFDLIYLGWTGLLFPNPETSYKSTLADANSTNNVTGIKNQRIDQLLDIYDREFDTQKRLEIIREIDGILANIHPYVLTWDTPYQRIAFWNKFGQPEGYLTRIGDYRDVPTLWWIDREKETQVARGINDTTVKMAVGTTEARYWQQYAQRQGVRQATAAGAD
ncbi:MAG TPA: extracellular solute-binding protein [Vicinamibacterales bacterium]|jgi:microcin C transport system substrate-binding protein